MPAFMYSAIGNARVVSSDPMKILNGSRSRNGVESVDREAGGRVEQNVSRS